MSENKRVVPFVAFVRFSRRIPGFTHRSYTVAENESKTTE